MRLSELFILAMGLSMDAFAVSICKGLCIEKEKNKTSIALLTGGFFGFFQAVMPLFGFYLGISFRGVIEQVDHWIAFFLLSFIGMSMIRDSRKSQEYKKGGGIKELLFLSIATSIDAFAVGMMLAFLKVNIFYSILWIGFITFILSSVGVQLGILLGNKASMYSQKVGGGLLIFMGVSILMKHLGIWA